MTAMNRTLPYMNAYGTVDISSANNVEEALGLSGLNWDVESRPIFDANGNEYPNYRANVRATDNEMLGIVSDRYRVVQNSDAFEFVNDLTTDGFEFDRAGCFKNGKSIWVMGHFENENILGDDIGNNIIFVNSHDGSSGVKVMMTPVRIICSNMLNLALKKAERSWTSKHTNSIFSRLDEAKYTLGLANDYMEALKEEADILSNITITQDKIDEIFDKLFPVDPVNDTPRKIRNISLLRDNYIKCYNEQDIARFKGTAYGAINAMSDLVSHKSPARNSVNFYENSWNRLINGHSVLDNFYKALR